MPLVFRVQQVSNFRPEMFSYNTPVTNGAYDLWIGLDSYAPQYSFTIFFLLMDIPDKNCSRFN